MLQHLGMRMVSNDGSSSGMSYAVASTSTDVGACGDSG
jgi:hypothetical protein